MLEIPPLTLEYLLYNFMLRVTQRCTKHILNSGTIGLPPPPNSGSGGRQQTAPGSGQGGPGSGQGAPGSGQGGSTQGNIYQSLDSTKVLVKMLLGKRMCFLFVKSGVVSSCRRYIFFCTLHIHLVTI